MTYLNARHHGATLLEALVGLTLLGTLAVALVLARANLVQQQFEAERKLEAVRAADAMLATWSLNMDALPRSQRGKIEGYEHLTWRTVILEDEAATRLYGQKVRLEITDTRTPAPGSPGSPGSSGRPILAIELLLPGALQTEEPAASDEEFDDATP